MSKPHKRIKTDNLANSGIISQTGKNDYWLKPPITTSNRFEVLPVDSDALDDTPETSQNEPKPPPIFVAEVGYLKPLSELLEQIIPGAYSLKCLYNNQIKIQPTTSDSYRKTVKALQDKHTQFHTYQLKQDRSFRVVLRNMHPTIDKDLLKQGIEILGHEVLNISPIYKLKTDPVNPNTNTKQVLPLFNIELKVKPNNKEIYDVKSLLNMIVAFEPPYPKREVPQCMNCQRYGHTKRFCHLNPRCVKCAGNHQTVQCPRKERSSDVKCVLCEGNHPANYKGCIIYKELQKNKFPPLRNKQPSQFTTKPTQPIPSNHQPSPQANSNNCVHHTLRPGTTYAQIVSNGFPSLSTDHQSHSCPVPQQPTGNLEAMMTKLMERMDSILNLLTTMISKMN